MEEEKQTKEKTEKSVIYDRRRKRNSFPIMFLLSFFNLIMGQEFGSNLVWRPTEHKFLKGQAIINYTIVLSNPCSRITSLPSFGGIIATKDPCVFTVANTVSYWDCRRVIKQQKFVDNCPKRANNCLNITTTANDVFEIAREYCDEYIFNELNELVEQHKNITTPIRRKRLEPITITFFCYNRNTNWTSHIIFLR